MGNIKMIQGCSGRSSRPPQKTIVLCCSVPGLMSTGARQHGWCYHCDMKFEIRPQKATFSTENIYIKKKKISIQELMHQNPQSLTQ